MESNPQQSNKCFLEPLKMEAVKLLERGEISYMSYQERIFDIELLIVEMEQYDLRVYKNKLWLFFRGRPKTKVRALIIGIFDTGKPLHICMN